MIFYGTIYLVIVLVPLYNISNFRFESYIYKISFEETEEGSGQGSVCSPILANIYMHYVLVWWFKERVQPQLKGYSGLVVYADDFVVCFQYKEEAERFYEALKKRLEHFGLKIEEDKTRLIEFGRFAEGNRRGRGEGKPETFDFLGFTHYCSSAKGGWFRVKRKTSKKKFAKACRSFNKKIRDMRTNTLEYIFAKVNQMGHTILMVTHSTKAASRASRVMFIRDGVVFHQIYKGDATDQQMYQKISDTLTLLAQGGDRR